MTGIEALKTSVKTILCHDLLGACTRATHDGAIQAAALSYALAVIAAAQAVPLCDVLAEVQVSYDDLAQSGAAGRIYRRHVATQPGSRREAPRLDVWGFLVENVRQLTGRRR